MRIAWRQGERVREVEIARIEEGRYRVSLDGAALEVAVEPLGEGRLRLHHEKGVVLAEVAAAGRRRFVRLGTMDFVLEGEESGRRRAASGAGGGLEAPMPGVITRILVAPGEAVSKGQPLLALEAMKMEHVLRAPRDGRVARIAATAGQMVNGGVALIELEEAGS